MRYTPLTCIVVYVMCLGATNCLLFPKQTESRKIQDLCGIWSFRIDNSPKRNKGFIEKWWNDRLYKTGEVEMMPVPSSYNDITVRADIRDHIGWAWYDTEFFIDSDWMKNRVVLRFESVHYNTIVWVNGHEAMSHSGGHLPFQEVINSLIVEGDLNRITVAVNNTLTPTTLPPGDLIFGDDSYPKGYVVQSIHFDFFNYAGIDRQVRLLSIPDKASIQDISIVTNYLTNEMATIGVNIEIEGHFVNIEYQVLNKDGDVIIENILYEIKNLLFFIIDLKFPNLWYPHSMAEDSAYLYTLVVKVNGESNIDVYRQKFGIRSILVTDTQLLINDIPFYCHGVSKHEDSDIRGKGLDMALLVRDMNLMKWMGVNCLRTSHYPYAEEFMNSCDELGIVVIDEAPAVGLRLKRYFSNETLNHHKRVMKELVTRDRNHPSVIMWSVANEPLTTSDEADFYFKSIIEYTKSLDKTRPVTFVNNELRDIAGKYVDIFCFNRYYGWYADMGHTEVITMKLSHEIEAWYIKYRKPIIMTEYGADTLAGEHMLPAQAFTEEYQIQLIEQHHLVFDKYRTKYFIGELYWNFADFMTAQDVKRMVGNKKGMFTRQRQPKMAAYVLKKRYLEIISNETKV